MPSLLCTGTVRTSFPCTQISYAAQEHLQVRPLSRFLPLDPPDPLFPHLSPRLWYLSSGHWPEAHPPRPFPESNMARTTAPLTLEAPHPCHASTPHATPGGSHHNSTGAHLSRMQPVHSSAFRSPVTDTVRLRFLNRSLPPSSPSRCLTGHLFGSPFLCRKGPPVVPLASALGPSSAVPEA